MTKLNKLPSIRRSSVRISFFHWLLARLPGCSKDYNQQYEYEIKTVSPTNYPTNSIYIIIIQLESF